jgi:hypothetical protein
MILKSMQSVFTASMLEQGRHALKSACSAAAKQRWIAERIV